MTPSHHLHFVVAVVVRPVVENSRASAEAVVGVTLAS